MPQVIIASQNPVKVEATRQAFVGMFPKQQFAFTGISASSGVSDQPRTEEETLRGALNRTKAAMKAHQNGDFWVGIEGGIADFNHQMTAFAWFVIRSHTQISQSRSGTFFLPDKVADLVRQGKELGEADDIIFGEENSKHNSGAVGLLTGNLVDRTALYRHGLILALIPFKNQALYPPDGRTAF